MSLRFYLYLAAYKADRSMQLPKVEEDWPFQTALLDLEMGRGRGYEGAMPASQEWQRGQRQVSLGDVLAGEEE